MEKTIYELELHESVQKGTHFLVTRVPGGWIYTWKAGSAASPSIFVPFNDEYSKNKKPKLPEKYDFTPPNAW